MAAVSWSDRCAAVAVAVVCSNPYAGRWSDDLTELIDLGEVLGDELMRRCQEALGGPVESYGKGGIVGEHGELEHVAAVLHPKFGAPTRGRVGGVSILPSVKKRAAMGATLDIPLHHIKAMLVRSHFDAMSITRPRRSGRRRAAPRPGGRRRRPAVRPGRRAARRGRGRRGRACIEGWSRADADPRHRPIVSGDIDAPLLDGDAIRIEDGRIADVGQGSGRGRRGRRHRRPRLDGPARAHRLPRPPDGRRLHAAPAHARLHRVTAPRRGDHGDLGRRAPPPRPAQGHRRAEGPGDRRRTTPTRPTARAASRSTPERPSSSWAWTSRTSPSWPPPACRSSARSASAPSRPAPRPRRWSPGAGPTAWSRPSTPAARRSPASSAIGADDVLEARPDIVGHINGGTTALSEADIERLIDGDTEMAIEIVHCGNGRAARVRHPARRRGRRPGPGRSSATTPRRGPASSRSGSCG